MNKKIFWSDLETTGTDPHRHSIIQIACMIESEGKIIDSFESKMRPLPGREIDPIALAVNGVCIEETKEYPRPEEVYFNFQTFCAKHGQAGDKANRFVPAGYKNDFDLDFLNDWHTTMNSKFAFWDYLQFQPIDVYPICVALWRCGVLPIKNVQLGTVCEHYGIAIDAHDAMSDIKACREVTYKVLKGAFHGFGHDLEAL
jgi:DNA polymerase III epsilon subunit-like protein